MASKADIERPISLVKPAHAKSVQAILDRAHRQERSASKALQGSVDQALRVPRGTGLLSKTLGMALSHHGRTKKGAPSLRPVAPDTQGRAFHFSHSTVGRTSGSAGGRTASAGAGTGGTTNTGGGTPGASATGPTMTAATGSSTSTASDRAQPDLGSKEAGHQRYVERDAALAQDAAEEFGIVVEPDLQPSQSSEREAADGMEPGRGAHKDKVQESGEEKEADSPEQDRARPIEMDVAAMQKEIAKTARGRRTQTAEAAQAYIEDPTKVAPQIRHGHSNSFGTIGETFEERVAFWNAVQKHEREKDARTQIRLVLELPHEANPAARQEIVKKFCEEYERLGVPYWASIHAPTKKNDDRNHHAHIVHGIRPARLMVHPETGEKAWDFTITQTYKLKCRHKKTTHPFRQNVVKQFRDRGYVRDTRKRFAETANAVLEKAGCPVRYDARSYKDMGLDIEPMKHVDRVLTDKSKIHDFVVMDPEWTRRMIEQEMNAAAVERDKTYMDLKRVEKRLAEVSNSITKLRDANAKLPRNMKLSPLSRMTVTTAKVITRRMLEIEQAKIAQRFADEATERTIQHVIDATAPTSAHRDGKKRRAKPLDGAQAPDERAMAFLHGAAIEEMRLHRTSTAGRMRSLGMRAAAAYEQWRSEAEPPLRADASAEARRPQPAAGTQPHEPPPERDAAPNRAAERPQPAAAPEQATRPTVAFAPPPTPVETVLAMTPNGSERLRQGIMNTMARMQASTEALLSATNGPEELAEAVKAMIAKVMPTKADDTTANEGEQPAAPTAREPTHQTVSTTEPTQAPTSGQEQHERTEPSNAKVDVPPPAARPAAAETREASTSGTPSHTRPTAIPTATALGRTGRTPLRGAGEQQRPTGKTMPGEPDLFADLPQRETSVAPRAEPIGPDRGAKPARTADAETNRPTTGGSESRAPTTAQASEPAPAHAGDQPDKRQADGKTGDGPTTSPKETNETIPRMPSPAPKTPDCILGPDDFLPEPEPFKPLERTPGVAPPQLGLDLKPLGRDENAPAPVRRDRDAAGPGHETAATTAPPPAVPKETVPAVHAATEEDLRSEHARRPIEAERVEEKAKAEKTEQADAWAAQWADAAPKSDMDPGRISWVISSRPMRRDEPLQTMTNFIERHPELGLVYRSLAAGYRELCVDAAAMTRLLTRVAPSDRDTWDEIGIGCLTAHQVNLAKQHGDIEASAWANAWIAQAPRSILTFDHLTWTISGVAQRDAVFEKLCGLLNRRSTMDIRPNRQERELVMPIELLRAVLTNIVPDERPQWDQLGMECADASRANDDRLSRQFEEFRSDEEARARSALDQRPETDSISTDPLVDRAKIATDQPSIPSSNPPSSSPPVQTEITSFQKVSKALKRWIRPDIIKRVSVEPGRHDVGSTEQAQASSQSLGEQPLGIEFAAEMLAHSKFPPLRYDQSGTAWIVTREAVWNGTTSEASDAAAHGLGPAFERIGVSWVAQTYPANQKLTVYRTKIRDVAEALGQIPPKAFEDWIIRLRRATVSSDTHIRNAKTTGTQVVEPPKKAVEAEKSVGQRPQRTPDGGIGS